MNRPFTVSRITPLIFAMLFALLLAGCGRSEDSMLGRILHNLPADVETDSPVDGGTTDSSDPNAPKQIASDDLISFHLKTEENQRVRVADETGGARSVIYPSGMYTFDMKESDGKITVHAEFAEAAFDFDADKAAFSALNQLIKENDVAAMNGHSARNSALGTFIDLEAVYADGERIDIYAEGGISAAPYGWHSEIFIAFFDKLMQEYTGTFFAGSLVEDHSDPGAVKDFSGAKITCIYIEFCPDYDTGSMADEIPFANYRFQFQEGGVPVVGATGDCALFMDNGMTGEFTASDDDKQALSDWFRGRGLWELNGWDKESTVSGNMDLTLHVYFDNDTELSIEGEGADAIPPAWDPIEFLQFLRNMAAGHGVDLLAGRVDHWGRG
ncbi:MAG: hypothetical protein K5649_10090 [Lachnospiraceae bacterium]|nr:hypothetical protein [Lachnospiraceae bacterium]